MASDLFDKLAEKFISYYDKSNCKVSDINIDVFYDLDDDEIINHFDTTDKVITGSLERRFCEKCYNNINYYSNGLGNFIYFKIDTDNFGNCVVTFNNDRQTFTVYIICNNKKMCISSYYFLQNNWSDYEPSYILTKDSIIYICHHDHVLFQLEIANINDFNCNSSKFALINFAQFLVSDMDVSEHYEFTKLIERFYELAQKNS